MGELRGALAASVTPLREGGMALDLGALGPIVDFLAVGSVDGLLGLGTTGEGILLSVDERKRAAEAFVDVAAGRVAVAIHCGAQTTADTVALSWHACEAGADAVAVIGPPYFALDERALLEHFADAAHACDPLPFYVYEFAARSGYQVPLEVIQRLKERAPNLAGLKVSDTPWDRFEPYLIEGLDVLVGPEEFIHQGLQERAVGAVSGLAAAFPELIARVVREPTEEGAAEAGRLRAAVQAFPFHAALKHILSYRGVPIRPDVRAPLRVLDLEESARLEQAIQASLPSLKARR